MIRVEDCGTGIEAVALESLFKPFTQVDSGLARKFEGTGLGLVMVKLLAELHGGTVAVESQIGEGSCFTVWLPFRAALPSAEPLAGEAQEPAVTDTAADSTNNAAIDAVLGARALVVEDDAKSAELIRVQLEAEGFTVLHAATAEAALAIAQNESLSLITLNVMLPDGKGWQFLRRLKEIPNLHRIPVVIISILADRQKGFALGAAAVMQKPISRQELFDLLVELGLSPTNTKSLRVLVVDDDSAAVELTSARLTELGATVLRASGGREAIRIANTDLPDLIVLDLMMPDVTGFDVVEALNRHPQTTRIPIIVLTSKEITPEDRVRLNGYVATIMDKAGFESSRFRVEIRRAMAMHEAAI